MVHEIMRQLPAEDIVYYGDLARLPYGIKSKEQIIRFSCENAEFLIQQKVKAIVIACNSSASAGMTVLKKRYPLMMLDVIEPAARRAIHFSLAKRIGVIGTQATIRSRAYEKTLKKFNPRVKVFTQACPLFVPLVEEGWTSGKITVQIVGEYLKELVKSKIDTLILGCTHYPLLRRVIQAYVGPQVVLVDSAGPTVYHLQDTLQKLHLLSDGAHRGKLRIYVSDVPSNFVKVGEKFLGCSLNHIRVVSIKPVIKISSEV